MQTTRLHIVPLTPETLPTILRPPILDLATNISFHQISTFPENPYGFITLPTIEADKLRKKFHGSLLRGVKMRVEEARAKQSLEDEHTKDASKGDDVQPKSRKSKKFNGREKDIMAGVQLEEGRKVKRGWTESQIVSKRGLKQSNDKQESSKGRKARKVGSFTGKEECLFKTKLPLSSRDSAAVMAERHGKVKKRKRGGSNGEIVVHEFQNTERHASFLREKSNGASGKSAMEFVDGKGWVDGYGNVIEAGPAKRTRGNRRTRADAKMPEIPHGAATDEDDDDATSSSGGSSCQDQGSDDNENLLPDVHDEKRRESNNLGIDRTVERLSITRSSASPPPLSSEEPVPSMKSPDPRPPHPLETLFKRPAKAASQTPKGKPLLEVSTSFSFSDSGTQDVETRLNIPQTPFTQQDIRQRRERSAAPTPDTAVPGKTFGSVWDGPESSDIASDDEEEAVEIEALMHNDVKEASPKEGEKSEFAKWFYEHRGNNNRAWKRRRREAAKERRQTENRKRRGE